MVALIKTTITSRENTGPSFVADKPHEKDTLNVAALASPFAETARGAAPELLLRDSPPECLLRPEVILLLRPDASFVLS